MKIKVGVQEPAAYLEYAPEWSGFETLPSSFWQLDLATAKARRVYGQRVQYDLQLAGEFAVSERPAKNDQASQVVAKSLSSGDEVVILDRDVKLGGHYDREFIVDGTNVVARTDTGLLVYDLAWQEVARTVPVSDRLVEIYAAGADWAIATRNDMSGEMLLVRFETGEATLIPEPPDGFAPLPLAAVAADEYVFVPAYHTESETGPVTNRVLALHIPTLSWSTLVDYGETRAAPWGDIVQVTGADVANVLAEVFTPLGSSRIELIARDSGQRTTIARAPGQSPVCPLLHDGHVYWLSGVSNTLNVYDIAAGTRHAIPVQIPD